MAKEPTRKKILDIAQIGQAIATIIALGAGAWWFWVQRETYPRADLRQRVEVVPIERGVVAIETQLELENTGKQLVEVSYAAVKVQYVGSAPYGVDKLASLGDGDYWNALRSRGTPNPRHFAAGELRWPVLKQYDGEVLHHVEPGETDLLTFTFILNCDDPFISEQRSLERVRIASDIYKPLRDVEHSGGSVNEDEHTDPARLAWKARSFVDISEQCSRGAR